MSSRVLDLPPFRKFAYLIYLLETLICIRFAQICLRFVDFLLETPAERGIRELNANAAELQVPHIRSHTLPFEILKPDSIYDLIFGVSEKLRF